MIVHLNLLEIDRFFLHLNTHGYQKKEKSSVENHFKFTHGFPAHDCDVLNRQVSYRCVPAKPGALQKIRVCEGQQASIDCPKRSSIVIEYANYGRLKGPHVCGFLIVLTTNCAAESSFETVEKDCDGKDRCLLEANNAKFGKDPCFLTPKYLEVSDIELVYFVYFEIMSFSSEHEC